jgi:hypothetical protein
MKLRLYIVPVAIAFAAGVAARDLAQERHDVAKVVQKPSVPEEIYRTILCPPDWYATVTQEYLKRNSDGTVTKRIRIRYCI